MQDNIIKFPKRNPNQGENNSQRLKQGIHGTRAQNGISYSRSSSYMGYKFYKEEPCNVDPQ